MQSQKSNADYENIPHKSCCWLTVAHDSGSRTNHILVYERHYTHSHITAATAGGPQALPPPKTHFSQSMKETIKQ